MKFDYSAAGGGSGWKQRFFEILPGTISWTVLVGVTALSFTKPVLAAVIIIAFDFYWLLRLFYGTFFLLMSYLTLKRQKTTDWMERIRLIDGPSLRYEE